MGRTYLAALLPLLTGCAAYSPLGDVRYTMAYQTDREQYKVGDKWVAGCPPKGDCEDMSICLLEKLSAAGMGRPDDKMVVCFLPDGVAHALVKHDGHYYDPALNRVSEALPCRYVYGIGRAVIAAKVRADATK